MGMGRINRGYKTVYFTFSLIILVLLPTMGYSSQDVINVSKNPYKIGPSDLLDIQVWNEPDVSKQVRVLIDGTIVLPLVGQINAAGLTPSQLSESLKKKLSEYIAEPEVTVMVLEGKYNRYFIVGQIQNPGEYYIDYPISILQAIARAG
ncbi:MAG TPA: sugar ABC transporter substrate-binding protein, partial [Dissulfuribacter thermophilus]|nr:sugar ABC transporter substrate-binding protein [Dissulfuribacter thermophilus]